MDENGKPFRASSNVTAALQYLTLSVLHVCTCRRCIDNLCRLKQDVSYCQQLKLWHMADGDNKDTYS